MRNILGAVLCLLAPGAAYAEKLCIVTFKGPSNAVVREQIEGNLCVTNACVPPKQATKGGKPDWAKAKKEKVDFFVTGTIKAKGKTNKLDLQVFAKKGPPKMKKEYSYQGRDLPDKTLQAALAALEKAMGLEEKKAPEPKEEKKEPEPKEEKKDPEEKPAEKNPPDEEKPEEKPGRKPKEPREPPPPPKEDEREKPKEEEPPAEEEATRPVKPPLLSVEAGVDLFSRNFSYNAPETNNLRSYSAGLIVAPAIRVEVYPLSLISKGIVSGIGIDGSFAIAVGLKSRRSGTDVTWPTSLQHYDFSLRFRFRPVAGTDAAIIVFVGYANRSFSVGTGSDGSTLDGLPNVSYSALRPGLAGELPFSNSGFMIFARFAPLIVLSSGQIINPSESGFFKKGSNFGIEGSLGAGYRIVGPLSVRLAFDFVRYGLGFAPEPTDMYRAGGAVDTYLGGNLSVRLSF